jgi:hypothetical protein
VLVIEWRLDLETLQIDWSEGTGPKVQRDR